MTNHSNSVELIGYYGGDKRSCVSAWQSTTEELGITLPENIQDRVDVIFNHIAATKAKSAAELIKFLADHGHGTPFEKSHLDFQIKGDLASHIHSLKHRISHINGESARYKEFVTDKFYLPDDWKDIVFTRDVQDMNGATFAYAGDRLLNVLELYANLGYELYHQSCEDLRKILGAKRAKESSRYFLGYTTQLNYDWQMNFRSFINIQMLRNDAHAQREIHQIANSMLDLVMKIPGNPFEFCIKAFDLKVDPEFLL